MNEHIKALAKEHFCSTEFNDGTVHECYEFSEVELAKFVELIARECSKVIVNGGYRNPALGEKHPLTPPEIAKMIEEHFGVEE